MTKIKYNKNKFYLFYLYYMNKKDLEKLAIKRLNSKKI